MATASTFCTVPTLALETPLYIVFLCCNVYAVVTRRRCNLHICPTVDTQQVSAEMLKCCTVHFVNVNYFIISKPFAYNFIFVINIFDFFFRITWVESIP